MLCKALIFLSTLIFFSVLRFSANFHIYIPMSGVWRWMQKGIKWLCLLLNEREWIKNALIDITCPKVARFLLKWFKSISIYILNPIPKDKNEIKKFQIQTKHIWCQKMKNISKKLYFLNIQKIKEIMHTYLLKTTTHWTILSFNLFNHSKNNYFKALANASMVFFCFQHRWINVKKSWKEEHKWNTSDTYVSNKSPIKNYSFFYFL